MEFKKETRKGLYAIRITAEEGGKAAGWVYLYVLKNDLHDEPFGFLENLYVDPEVRGSGIGTKLVEEAIAEAKEQGCYKLVGTSRRVRSRVHNFYERLGFMDYGLEFRIDLKKSESKKPEACETKK